MSTINWADPISGTFTTQADWIGGVVPGPNDTAVIAASGGSAAYTVTVNTPVTLAGLDIDQARAQVLDTGTLTVGDIELQSGKLVLDRGTLAGTLTETGGVLDIQGQAGSTLDGMTFRGDVTISPKSKHVSSTVTVSNGLTLTGQDGTGPGGATFKTAVILDHTPTLDNGTVSFIGGNATTYGLAFKGNTLTFGAGLVVNATDISVQTGQMLVNDGVYNAPHINDLTQSASGTFINNGTILAQNNTSMSGRTFENAASFTNNGTIDIALNALILDAAGLQHAGANGIIELSQGAQIDLAGNLTTAQLLSDLAGQNITGTGTFGFGIDGTLDNTGTTLTVGLNTAYGALGDGTYNGGTIVNASGDVVSENFQTQTLENLTYKVSQSKISLENLVNTVVTGAKTIVFYPSQNNAAEVTGGTLSGVSTVDGADLILNGADITGAGGNGQVQVNFENLELTAAQDIGGYTLAPDDQDTYLELDANVTLNNATLSVGGQSLLHLYQSDASQGVTLGAAFTTTIAAGSTLMAEDLQAATPTINEGAISNAGTLLDYGYFDNEGTITSSGYIDAGGPNNASAQFNNAGNITITTGGVLDASYSPNFTNSGTIAVIGGELDVSLGKLNNSGAISVTNGTLGLFGNSTVGSLTEIAAPGSVAVIHTGTLDLGGATIDLGSGDIPLLEIAADGTVADGTISIAQGQVLTDYGTITAALINNGQIALKPEDGTKISLDLPIAGIGTISLSGDASGLSLGVPVASQFIALTGSAQTLSFLSPQDVSGFGGTLGGYSVGDAIVLGGETLASAAFVGKSIVATLSNGATISLATSTALHGTIEVRNTDELYYTSSGPQNHAASATTAHDDFAYGGRPALLLTGSLEVIDFNKGAEIVRISNQVPNPDFGIPHATRSANGVVSGAKPDAGGAFRWEPVCMIHDLLATHWSL